MKWPQPFELHDILILFTFKPTLQYMFIIMDYTHVSNVIYETFN